MMHIPNSFRSVWPPTYTLCNFLFFWLEIYLCILIPTFSMERDSPSTTRDPDDQLLCQLYNKGEPVS